MGCDIGRAVIDFMRQMSQHKTKISEYRSKYFIKEAEKEGKEKELTLPNKVGSCRHLAESMT